MKRELLLEELNDKEKFQELVIKAVIDTSFVQDLIDIITNEKGSVKFRASKTIRTACEKNPGSLYPFFDEIADFIKSENSFIKWDGISAISYLVESDTEGKFDDLYDEYFRLLEGPQMITAANVAGCVPRIVASRPDLEHNITSRLLNIPNITYLNKGKPSPECNLVLRSKVIKAFEEYYPLSDQKDEMMSFVTNQLNSNRKSLAKEAISFLNKHSREQ